VREVSEERAKGPVTICKNYSREVNDPHWSMYVSFSLETSAQAGEIPGL